MKLQVGGDFARAILSGGAVRPRWVKREFIGRFINLLLNIQKCIFAKSLFYERRMHYLQSASGVSE